MLCTKMKQRQGSKGQIRGTLDWALRTGFFKGLNPHSRPSWEELLFHDEEIGGQRYR